MPSYMPTTADYTSSNFGDYSPEEYSAKFNVKFYKNTHLTETTNTNWEGDLKGRGSIVYIDDIPSIVATEVVEGQEVNYQRPEAVRRSLKIDRQVEYAVETRTLMLRQTHHKDLTQVMMSDGSKASTIKIDRIVLNETYTSVPAANKGATAGVISGSYNMGVSGTPLIFTKANVLDNLVYARAVLAEQDIPNDQCFAVLPIPIASMLKLSDLKDASFSGKTRSWLLDSNGRIGETIDGLQIYVSNNYVPIADGSGKICYHMKVGHKSATTFAAQLTDHNMNLTDIHVYGEFHRDRVSFGFSVVNPNALADVYCTI